MSASKNRPRWGDLPPSVRGQIEDLVGDEVAGAENCQGGFSPGFASRLTLASGKRAFAKAVDGREWPSQVPMYRDEAHVAATLPARLPAPRFLGSRDDGRWVIMAFECIEGAEPLRPWRPADLARVVATAARMSVAASPSPVQVPSHHPRLGGWLEISAEPTLRARLDGFSRWAARELDELIALEERGLVAARGATLVHFDALPHNIVLTRDRVYFVDWPHARLGAPFIDLLMLLTTAWADGIDPEPLLTSQPIMRVTAPADVDAVLAAFAGFCLVGGLGTIESGLQPIAAAKRELGRGALGWLQRRRLR
jgi:Phosphotransferase enzyme family